MVSLQSSRSSYLLRLISWLIALITSFSFLFTSTAIATELTTASTSTKAICANPENDLPCYLPGDFHPNPNSPEEAQYAYYDYMWKSFIAVNWPNVPLKVEGNKIVEGFRGEPDTQTSIVDQTGTDPLRLSVWETYREPSTEVFLDPSQWNNFPNWNTPRQLPSNINSQKAKNIAKRGETIRSLKNYDGLTEYAVDINQPYFFPYKTGPLIDQKGNFVRYEVGVNQAFFSYIKHFQYYDAEQQKNAVAYSVSHPDADAQSLNAPINEAFQRPPHGNEDYLTDLPPFAQQGLVDVKAAWRVLTNDDRRERYLHRQIIDGNGQIKEMGLVALHILRFVLTPQPDGSQKPIYIASTFEQVDNVSSNDPHIKPSFNDGSSPSEVQKSYGFEGAIPPQARKENPARQKPVDIYRVTPIEGSNIPCSESSFTKKTCVLPYSVTAINKRYQKLLGSSVFSYYQLIGTENVRPDRPLNFNDAKQLEMFNGPEGLKTGVYTNTSNLINSALESYTQKNFSCILCHAFARPQGVPPQALEDNRFKIATFLLNIAKSASTTPPLDNGEY